MSNTQENKLEPLLDISAAINHLKIYLEVNAGKLCEPILKQGKNPKDDAECHNFSFKNMASKLYVLNRTFSERLPKF